MNKIESHRELMEPSGGMSVIEAHGVIATGSEDIQSLRASIEI
jgi:hypothetical protein